MATLDLTADSLDVVCDGGDDETVRIQPVDNNGAPVDLTSFTFTGSVILGGNGLEVPLTVVVTSTLLSFRIPAALTSNIKAAGRSPYLIKCQSTGGDVQSLFKGWITAR